MLVKKIIKFVYGLVFLTAIGTLATVVPQEELSSTKSIMSQFLTHLTGLRKYMGSQEIFTDPKNNYEISMHLKEFSKLAKKAHEDVNLQKTNFKFSREVLEEHIIDTERLFRLGNKSFARWKLSSTLSVCMSCHTQMPGTSKVFEEIRRLKPLTSDFEQAEFLFAIRDFESAYKIYDQAILSFPKGSFDSSQIEMALGRQLMYFSRIKKDPAAALVVFEKYRQLKNLPAVTRADIASWVQQFQKWTKQPLPSLTKATDQQILDFVKSKIDVKRKSQDIDFVTYLQVSGLLYEFLQYRPESKVVPEILYWLSICDRAMHNTFFYSLADLYLRECITKYPTDPIALKCFQEYETQVILGYTGSRGVDMPQEVADDLKQLEKLVTSQKFKSKK